MVELVDALDSKSCSERSAGSIPAARTINRCALVLQMREQRDKAIIGDLVRITGRIGQSKYKVEGQTHTSVDLIADSVAILAKAKVRTVEGDMQD